MTKTKKITSILLAILIAATIFVVPVSVQGASKLGKVTGLKETKATYNSVTVSFNAVKGAKGYRAYVSTSKTGKYKKVGWQSADLVKKCLFQGLSANQTYWVKIQATALKNGGISNKDGALSDAYKVRTVLGTVKKITVKKVETKKISVSFASVKGAKGYQGYISTSKSGKYKKVGWQSADYKTFLFQGLKSKTTYYIKIKATANSNGTTSMYDGALSDAKAVKTK